MRFFLFASLFVAGGCIDSVKDVDSDGDGLMDADEAAAGTDPAVADSDADGLADGAEIDLGTDPRMADSDGDTYLDGWEVTEGKDPLDENSRIYTGYWPYNPNKGDMEEVDFSGHTRVGKSLPHFAWTDQFGEQVDVYDMAGHGKPVVLDLSGAWCYWCQEVAKLIEGRRSALQGAGYDDLDTKLEAGDFLWVTVLDADVGGTSIDKDEIAEWYDTYTNELVPVLADENQDLTAWIAPEGYPTIMLLDENLQVTVYDPANYMVVFDELNAQFPSEGE